MLLVGGVAGAVSVGVAGTTKLTTLAGSDAVSPVKASGGSWTRRCAAEVAWLCVASCALKKRKLTVPLAGMVTVL